MTLHPFSELDSGYHSFSLFFIVDFSLHQAPINACIYSIISHFKKPSFDPTSPSSILSLMHQLLIVSGSSLLPTSCFSNTAIWFLLWDLTPWSHTALIIISYEHFHRIYLTQWLGSFDTTDHSFLKIPSLICMPSFPPCTPSTSHTMLS